MYQQGISEVSTIEAHRADCWPVLADCWLIQWFIVNQVSINIQLTLDQNIYHVTLTDVMDKAPLKIHDPSSIVLFASFIFVLTILLGEVSYLGILWYSILGKMKKKQQVFIIFLFVDLNQHLLGGMHPFILSQNFFYSVTANTKKDQSVQQSVFWVAMSLDGI